MAEAVALLANPESRADGERMLLDAGPEAVPALLAALAEATGSAALAIVETLGRLGDLRAVSALRRILRHSEPGLAAAAAEALAYIPHGAAIWALSEGASSSDAPVRIASLLSLALHAACDEAQRASLATEALSALTPDDVAALVSEARLWRLPSKARDLAFACALEVDPGAAVAAVLPHLRRQPTAQGARDALRRVEAVHPLIFQLTADTAADILPVLADIGSHLQRLLHGGVPPDDGEYLQTTLRDIVTVLFNWYDPEDAELAAIVIGGMQVLGDDASNMLAGRLAHADADERPYILSLLRALHWQPQGDEEGIYYWLATGEWDRLATLGPMAIEPLLAEFAGYDLARREGAARALARLGWQPEDRLSEYRLAIAIGRWDALPRRDPAARTLLLEALAEERAAAWAVPRGGIDERVSRRLTMVRALARHPAPDATRGLLVALRDDPSAQVREEAAHCLEEKGRDAMALIVEALSSHQGETGIEARYRCDLVHLLARRGKHARPALGVLRRVAANDPSPLVRDAASAAIARIAPPAREPFGGPGFVEAPTPERVSLAPRATADVGQVLRSGGQATPQELAQQLDARDRRQAGRAIAALVAMGRAGTPVMPALESVLLTASPDGRRAAAQVLDRLGLCPQRPEGLAAYHLAHGDLARCEAIGAPARSVLREALPLLDWRSAGAVALSLLRLGEPLQSPVLSSAIELLERVASLPDTRLDEMLLDDDHDSRVARGVTLAVSRDADRRAARALLAALHEEASRLLTSPPNTSGSHDIQSA